MRTRAGGTLEASDMRVYIHYPACLAAVTGRSFVTFCYDNLVWDYGAASLSASGMGVSGMGVSS